jgi:hypothetical protein
MKSLPLKYVGGVDFLAGRHQGYLVCGGKHVLEIDERIHRRRWPAIRVRTCRLGLVELAELAGVERDVDNRTQRMNRNHRRCGTQKRHEASKR